MPTAFNIKRDYMTKLIRKHRRITIAKLSVLTNIAPQTIRLNYREVILDLCDDIDYDEGTKEFFVKVTE